MAEEQWTTINGFQYYMVSTLGNIMSLERTIKQSNGRLLHIRQRVMKPGRCKNGYLHVNIVDDAGRRHTFAVHRLVATAFVPNESNRPCVNHINNCRQDNRACNLQWVTHRENNNYGTRNEKISEALKGRKKSPEYLRKRSKPVTAFNPVTGQIVGEFPSATIAERAYGFSQRRISECCTGKHYTHRGFGWRFRDTFSSTYKQKTQK